MVEFWSDHFHTNINVVGIFKTLEDREVYPAAMRSARSATMLDRAAREPGDADLPQQHAEHADRRPNQNYARELMELHTLGVDGGYTQQDVVEVARCFTGWRRHGNTGDARAGHVLLRRQPARQQRKIVLGVPIAAGGGINDGLNVCKILAEHPSTARFVSRKLLRWLLDYDPSPALVADIAGEFTRSGGNIKALVRRILHVRERALGAAALQAAVPLHRVGAARPRTPNITTLDTIRDTYLSGTGPRAVRVGTAERVSAGVRVLGRAAAAALELRLQRRQQQRRRGDVRPDGAAGRRHDRGADCRSDRGAVCSPATCRLPTRRRSSRICGRAGRRRAVDERIRDALVWRSRRRPFNGTDAAAVRLAP